MPQALGHVGADRQPQRRLVARPQRGNDHAVVMRRFVAEAVAPAPLVDWQKTFPIRLLFLLFTDSVKGKCRSLRYIWQ